MPGVIRTAVNEEETGAIAAELAELLAPGDVLCLSGDLGAGKTTFTRGLVAGLRSPDPVSSPTFTLIHEYPGGRLPVYHVDAYRLHGIDDALSIGLEEYLTRGDGVTVIEWPAQIATLLPVERLDITLMDDSEDGEGRQLSFEPHGPRWTGMLERLSGKEKPSC